MSQQNASDPTNSTQNSVATVPTTAELTKRAKELTALLAIQQSLFAKTEEDIRGLEARAQSELDQNLYEEAEITQTTIKDAITHLNEVSAQRTSLAVDLANVRGQLKTAFSTSTYSPSTIEQTLTINPTAVPQTPPNPQPLNVGTGSLLGSSIIVPRTPPNGKEEYYHRGNGASDANDEDEADRQAAKTGAA